MPDPNPLTARFQESDVPPGIETNYAAGMVPTRATPVAQSQASMSLGDRAKVNLQRAIDGMSSLFGRQVTPPDRTAQLESGLNTLQARSTPNILTTIPRFAPIATPAQPVGTPVSQPTPFSFDGWMAKQNSKGS
jgi:hypothetical protein